MYLFFLKRVYFLLFLKDGFGNVTAGCKLCDCDAIGSQSELCDPQSGQCPCKPGVAGDQCNQCLPSYYGFSTDGCKSESKK